MDSIEERLATYDKDHCWQYEMRLQNTEEDLSNVPMWYDVSNLTVKDFEFKPLETQAEKELAGQFIKRHEWLGRLALNTTHYFGAFYQGILAGVVTMGEPAAYSNMMGENTRDIERLISRGACISWSPKGLASSFIMWCIRWMVQNTQYRLFTAYSDPSAKELGTIYQACSFYYLGKEFGANEKYISPYSGKLISDRTFRSRSYYKRYAEELGIPWGKDWSDGDAVYWDNIPDDVEIQLREFGKNKQSNSTAIAIPKKHKYAFVLGVDHHDTKLLRRQFLATNKVYPYPKERGK